MSKLQELLDERWPITKDGMHADAVQLRKAFIEGYNAAMEQFETVRQKPGDASEWEILKYCKDLIQKGRKTDAIATYKRETGCSVTQAKAILNL